ncbi:molecular chaperone, partial [Pseudomonas aeruginosa]|nr:molecular chaperone [Pseudomonas aeruginosa]
PAGIQGRPEDLPGQLRFALVRRSAGWAVRVDNPSGYYASFASATLSVGQRRWRLRSGMLEPRSHAEWQAETREALPQGRVRLHALLINDYGAHMD